MVNKHLRNILSKLQLNPKIVKKEIKHYTSLYQFLGDYPLPKEAEREYAHLFYWALYNKVRDADLPFSQRAIRSNLLVKLGVQSGIINTNKGANL